MEDLVTLTGTYQDPKVKPSKKLEIKLHHDSNGLSFESDQLRHDGANANIANGDAVLSRESRIKWIADQSIDSIEIELKDTRDEISDIWEEFHRDNGNQKGWTGKVKIKKKHLKHFNGSFLDMEYKVKYFVGNESFEPDPIIRVNK